jgi:hypothetical protein
MRFEALLFGGEVLHGVQEQGPRFDCWISVHTFKRLAKKVGVGEGGEKSVGQLCLWQLVAFFLFGEQLTKFGTIEKVLSVERYEYSTH